MGRKNMAPCFQMKGMQKTPSPRLAMQAGVPHYGMRQARVADVLVMAPPSLGPQAATPQYPTTIRPATHREDLGCNISRVVAGISKSKASTEGADHICTPINIRLADTCYRYLWSFALSVLLVYCYTCTIDSFVQSLRIAAGRPVLHKDCMSNDYDHHWVCGFAY